MNMKDGLIPANRSFFVNYLSLFYCEGYIYWQMKNDSNSVALSALDRSLDREV